MEVPYATWLTVKGAMHSRISQGHYRGGHLSSEQQLTVKGSHLILLTLLQKLCAVCIYFKENEKEQKRHHLPEDPVF